MKKMIIGFLVMVCIGANAQIKISDIKGDYCEFAKVSALGKEGVVVYTQTDMQKLLNDDGTEMKFSKVTQAIPVLCAFAEKGWTLKYRYEENRGSMTQIYLMERKK